MKKFAALVATLFACVIATFSSVALAGSGAAPIQIDPSNFTVGGVRHEPGSSIVEVYGSSNRAGTMGSDDASRLKATDNGVSDTWAFEWLYGIGRTAVIETSTMPCPTGTFCANKVFVLEYMQSKIWYGDLAADGLTVTNVTSVPGYNSAGGFSIIGNKLVSSGGFTDYIQLVDIISGTSTDLTTCSSLGYANYALANPSGGYLYLVSDFNGLGGSWDLFRQPFNGAVCTGGRTSLNAVPGYGNPNTTNSEKVGGVDPLTGDVYYTSSGDRAFRLKLTPSCGDKFISGIGEPGGEQCDPTSPWPLNAQTCVSLGLGFTGGTLACNPTTCQFNTSGCTSPATCGDSSCNGTETCSSCPQDCGACCGNGAIDAGEDCDGLNLDGATCSSVMGAGYTGSLSCSSCSFVTAGCVAPPLCGDATCNGTETWATCPGDCPPGCGDAACNGGETWATCPGDCPAACGDTFCNGSENCSTCPGDCGACCGNGTINVGEDCDGLDLNGATCSSEMGAGYTGSLSCSACSFVTAACVPPPSCGDTQCNGTETCATCPGDCGVCCGNGNVDSGEDCDGGNLGGATCESVVGVGYTGSVSCTGSCSFDTTACTAPPTCNNGSLDPGEQCDGANLAGATCESEKGTGWTGSLTCSSCQLVTTACTFDWGISSLAGACSLSGEGAAQTISFTGGDCEAEYWPIGAVTPAYIKWASVAGKVLLVGVTSAGTETNVIVPQGVSHTEVVDNGNKYQLQWSSGTDLAVEGTTYGAVETVWPEVVFGCTDGAIALSFATLPVAFSVAGGSQGRLPAGWGVGVNVLTGAVTIPPFDLGGGGTGGAGGEAGAGGSAGEAGSGGDAGTGGTGGTAGSGGSATGGTGGNAGEAGSAGSTPVAPSPSGGDDGGCSTCTTGASHNGSNAAWLMLGLLALVASRRRRV